jgi:hypothetical protein
MIVNQLADHISSTAAITSTRTPGISANKPKQESISTTQPIFKRGESIQELVPKAVSMLIAKIRTGEIENYYEFSVQHELGIILRETSHNQLVQFERNISYFGFQKTSFEKREMDICVYSMKTKELVSAVELKFPRNGQHPEQMYSFCKDLAFVEQLMAAGFAKTYLVIFAGDPLFYEGNKQGIYGCFRGGKVLTGRVTKPTGKKDTSVMVKARYTVKWIDVVGTMKCSIIEASG